MSGVVNCDINGDDRAAALALDTSGKFVAGGDSDGFCGIVRVIGGDRPNEPPAVEILSPAQGEVFAIGDSITLSAGVSDTRPSRSLWWSAGTDPNFSYRVDWVATPGAHVVRAVATDSYGLRTVSRGRLFFVAAPVIPRTAEWKHIGGYDPGTAWREPAFEDSSWASGPAELGFGDGDEATELPPNEEFNYPTTYYFRRHFSVPAAGPANYATARLLRDDGAAVYLNGQRVGLFNLPDDFDNWTAALVNLPNRSVNEEAEDTIHLPANLLTGGDNVLAVEVHQASTFPLFQRDLSFSLTLGIFSYDPGPVLTSTLIDGGVRLRWPDYLPDWVLQRSTDLVTWTSAPGTPVISGEQFTLDLLLTGSGQRGFFRLGRAAP